MGKNRFTSEQIISKLREAEVLQSNGQSITEICCHLGIKGSNGKAKSFRGENISLLGQPRSTRRRKIKTRNDEPALGERVIN